MWRKIRARSFAQRGGIAHRASLPLASVLAARSKIAPPDVSSGCGALRRSFFHLPHDPATERLVGARPIRDLREPSVAIPAKARISSRSIDVSMDNGLWLSPLFINPRAESRVGYVHHIAHNEHSSDADLMRP